MASTVSPAPGATFRRASARYARNRPGSASPSSSESHATGILHPATHSATRVLLPKPAGAEKRQPAPEPFVEPLVEAGAEDDPWSAWRDVELGRQDRYRHHQMLGRGLAGSTVRLHLKRASMAVADAPSNTSAEV